MSPSQPLEGAIPTKSLLAILAELGPIEDSFPDIDDPPSDPVDL